MNVKDGNKIPMTDRDAENTRIDVKDTNKITKAGKNAKNTSMDANYVN